MEDGMPFCAQCGAPQIRVTIERPEDEPPLGDLASRQKRAEAATDPLLPGTPGDLQPPAVPVFPQHSSNTPPFSAIGLPAAEASTKLVRPAALRTAILVGVIAGMLTLLPNVPILVLIMIAAGAVSVPVYRARIGRNVAGAEGFRLGSLTGLFCSLLKTVVSVAAILIPEGRAEMMKQLDAQVATAMARNADPASQEMVRKMAEWFRTPDGFATMFMIGLVVVLLFSMLLSGLGGLLGASFFGRQGSGTKSPRR